MVPIQEVLMWEYETCHNCGDHFVNIAGRQRNELVTCSNCGTSFTVTEQWDSEEECFHRGIEEIEIKTK